MYTETVTNVAIATVYYYRQLVTVTSRNKNFICTNKIVDCIYSYLGTIMLWIELPTVEHWHHACTLAMWVAIVMLLHLLLGGLHQHSAQGEPIQ